MTPFLKVAAATGFPADAAWLWIGPSGPHIIGKAVRELARQTGGMDPFSVDFDPRHGPGAPSSSRDRWPDSATSTTLPIRRWTCWNARPSTCCSPHRRH